MVDPSQSQSTEIPGPPFPHPLPEQAESHTMVGPTASDDHVTPHSPQQSMTSPDSVISPPERPPTFAMEENQPPAEWKSSAHLILFSYRTGLTILSIAAAILLTMFSSSGVVKFEGETIKWKLLLYTLQLEVALFVFMHDILALAIDYLLVFKGMTRSQLGHALSITCSVNSVQGLLYKVIVYTVAAIGAIVAPILLSVVLAREATSLVSVADMNISTNCLGGRVGPNFGATGQSYIFNFTHEKFRIKEGAQHYATYDSAGSTRIVFVPKTPQIGSYSTDCNSEENVDIIQARIIRVQGLLYTCRPTVEERALSIGELQDIGNGTAADQFRILNDSHVPAQNDKTKALFNVSFAINKDQGSTVILNIPCDVTAAEATLDVVMNPDGIMGMEVVDDKFTEISEKLPPRVVGDKENLLFLSLENAIGRSGISIVKRWVATDISVWDGLIRGVVAAYGIRSAFRDTFADKDDKRLATGVRRRPDSTEDLQVLRTFAIWIPVCLALFSRLMSWAFPSIFNGGLGQLLTWMGLEQGGVGGKGYRELGKEQVDERELFLNVKVVKGETSTVGLGTARDNQIQMGSYTSLKRLTYGGLLAGFKRIRIEYGP